MTMTSYSVFDKLLPHKNSKSKEIITVLGLVLSSSGLFSSPLLQQLRQRKVRPEIEVHNNVLKYLAHSFMEGDLVLHFPCSVRASPSICDGAAVIGFGEIST